ncbi:unnamed protein product, partial [Symbiodinium necroappetens]
MNGPEAWSLPALLPREADDSRLKGKMSERRYRKTARLIQSLGFKSFRELHDCYLATDVLALADVIQEYRKNFWQHFRLDPVGYVTLPSASWDAMLRVCTTPQTPLYRITVHKIYDLIRANIRGGVSNAFQLSTRANTDAPGLKPTSWLHLFDVRSQYPSIMAKPLPADGELPKLTDYLTDSFEKCYLVVVDYDFFLGRYDFLDWA